MCELWNGASARKLTIPPVWRAPALQHRLAGCCGLQCVREKAEVLSQMTLVDRTGCLLAGTPTTALDMVSAAAACLLSKTEIAW